MARQGGSFRQSSEAGFYTSLMNTQHALIQILTVEELLAGKKVDMPIWRERHHCRNQQYRSFLRIAEEATR